MSTQAPRVGGRECPVGDGTPNACGRTVRPGYLMCGAHWAQVPKPIQTSVWRLWRGWQRTPTDALWQEYLGARQDALDVFATPLADLPSQVPGEELDAAALVLVIAPDGGTRMWYGGDRPAAARALERVWLELSGGAQADSRH